MRWLFYIVVLSVHFVYIITENCPSKCSCKHSTAQRDGGDWVKVRCGDIEPLHVVDDNEFLNIANEVVQLNLSNNSLTNFAPKVQFEALQKLDLSKNLLVQLTNNQFSELPNLRRLDVSGNHIKMIDLLAFNNLQYLDSLKLSQNLINTIEKGTFDTIHNLKDLDISSNPLKCDCSLLWLLDWTKKMTVKLKSNPKCETPQAYFGKPLRKIKVGEEIHCKSPAKNRDMPIVELIPDHSQVVFEGDSLKLECRAPSIHEEFYRNEENEELHDRVEWLWLDTNPRHHFPDIVIDNRFLADDGLIDSSLSIRTLHRNHSGVWNCLLVTQQGNHSKGITVMVISEETRYCPIAMTNNNKGSYTWPRTVVNYTVTLPCESLQQTSDVSEQRASYHCSMLGEWSNLNTSKCPYISETTKILEQFAKVNLSLAKGSILESAKHLRNTSDIKLIRDVMDFVYATRTIYNYLDHLEIDGELGPLLLDIINGFMDLDDHFIREANLDDNSCSKLIRAVERITNFTQSQQMQKSHIILEQFHVRREIFTGITCTWYLNGLARNDKIFHCVTSNITNTVAAQNKEIEASIEVPSNIFYQLQEADITISSSNLLVGMFDNGKFFPLQEDKHEKIVSSVVGVKLDNLMVNLTNPIYIMLKPFETYSYELIPPTPVWWNPTLNFGRGAWTSEGCELRHELKDNLVFSCNNLGYYGLLQDTSHIHIVQTGAKFRFSHPAIYAGSLVLFFCLLLCIVSYIFSYSAIQMPKKAKHSVINMWLSISLLCFIYVFGIYQTEDVQLCQIIGLILHYLTLSSLLWMCVAVNSMYKRLRKNSSSDVIELQDDELPSGEPIQKPILGLYLVGWGIALIVCGISGAVNMKEYSAHTHCFLSSGPALSALYIPFGILLMVLFVLFLLIRCAIYGTDANGHLSEGTQATENVDLDLLEPNFPDCRSMQSVSTKTASSEVEDPEHVPMAQLKAHVIFLILYILAWCSCALATMNKYKMIPYEEDVFSIIYAILASLLGLFAFFFYCVARNDVRNEWALTKRLMRGRGKCFRTRNISDLPQIQIQPLPPIPDVHVHSRSSSRSSSHTKSVQSNALKAAVDLNASTMTDNSITKINNVNLVVLHRQQYRNNGAIPNLIENPTHSAEMFYNPHQSTVARKFFKKQKRHMMKRNNLTARRPPPSLQSDASMISSYCKRDKDNTNMEASMFANNAKVNNTNIHVEHIPKRHRNLNILSDSCEDLNSVEIPVDKLLERERRNKGKRAKKKQNVANVAISNISSIHENNMRSVSQQCTLEYSSEPISDSILDQKSPEKPSFTTDTTPSDFLASVRRENSPNMSTLTEEPQFYAIPKGDFTAARIYVNPTHEFKSRAQSRASSVSATEIEELYQQIKRGPVMKSRRYRKGRDDPYLSDSEVRSYSKSEKDETTV